MNLYENEESDPDLGLAKIDLLSRMEGSEEDKCRLLFEALGGSASVIDDVNGVNSYSQEAMYIAKKGKKIEWTPVLNTEMDQEEASKKCGIELKDKSDAATTWLRPAPKPEDLAALYQFIEYTRESEEEVKFVEQIKGTGNKPRGVFKSPLVWNSNKPAVGTLPPWLKPPIDSTPKPSFSSKQNKFETKPRKQNNMRQIAPKSASNPPLTIQTAADVLRQNDLNGVKRETNSNAPSAPFKPPYSTKRSVVNNSGAEPAVALSDACQEIIDDERLKSFDPILVERIISEIVDNGPKVDWDQICGLELVKKRVKELVVLPMIRPDLFTGLRAPGKGLLLFGPPGTGKTLIGKCVASHSKATFFNISASVLTSKWVGDGEKMVRCLFAVGRLSTL